MVKSVSRPPLNVYQQGGTVTIVDDTGAARQTIGAQPDGSFAVVAANGTTPGKPSLPIVAPSSLGLVVTWDGLLAGNATSAPLNSNTGFETGVDPWLDGGGVLAQSSARAHSGSYSGQMTPGDGYTQVAISSELVPVIPGRSYKAAAFLWLTTAVTNGFSLSVAWYDTDRALLSTSVQAASVAATTWAPITNTFTAPTDAVWAQLVPTLTAGSGTAGTVAPADVFWADEVTVGEVNLYTPADFDHVEVHVSATSGFTPTGSTLVGTLNKPGNFPVTPLDSDTTYFVRLVGVNTSGVSGAASAQASGVPSAVVATDISDGIVTTLKLADDAVTQAKIAAGAVGTAEIAGNAVSLAKLADGSVNAAKLVNGAVGTSQLGAGVVDTTKLADGSVSAAKVASNAIGSGALQAGAVVAGKIAADAVGADQIVANAITAGKVSAGAIGATQLAANSVVAGKIAANSVDAAQLVAGSVQTGKIAAGAVDTGQLAAEAVTADKIQALAVTAVKIAANAITAGAIQAGAVTADKLAATLVLASELIAGTAAGARVQVDSTGINAYSDQGDNTVSISSDGSATFTGASVTAEAVNAGQLTLSSPGGGIFLYSASASPVNANPDFSVNAANWTAGSGSTGTYSTAQLYIGHGTLQISTANSSTIPFCTSENVAVTAGAQYAAQAIIYNNDVGSGFPSYLEITWLNAANVVVGRSIGPAADRSAFWTPITVSGTAPAAATKARIRVGLAGNANPDKFYVGYGALFLNNVRTTLANLAGVDGMGNAYPAGLSTGAAAISGTATVGKLAAGNIDIDQFSLTTATRTGPSDSFNGRILVPHSLGITPRYFGVEINGPANGSDGWNSWQVLQKTSSNVLVQCKDVTGAAMANSKPVTGTYFAFG